jgi:hypothetical protein
VEVNAMKLIRNVFAAGLLTAATVMACSSQQGSTGTAGNGTGNVGTVGGQKNDGTGIVGANLSLAPGVSLTALNWTISNGTNSYSGTVQIGDAQSVEWQAGGILAGSGYSVTVTGADSLGEPCTGGTTTTFSVGAGATTFVGLAVVCAGTSDAAVAADVGMGNVFIDASVSRTTAAPTQCPGITALSIDPAEQLAGVPSSLTLATTGPASTITWSVVPATGGTFSNPNSATPTFTCAASSATTGSLPLRITATVALPDSGACAGVAFTTMTGIFQCEQSLTGADSGTVVDSGTVIDTGVDTGVDSGTATDASDGGGAVLLAACTTSTAACVQCQGNASGLCSPTEAVIVNFDIAQNVAVAPGPAPAASCYNCLLQAGCIDDTIFPDSGHECGDLTGSFTAGDGNTGTASSLCLATVQCVIGSACAETNGGLDNCYCGAGGGSPSACPGNGAATNGVCKTQETNGFLAAPTDATNTLKNFTDTTEPSGLANQIFICAQASSCTQCLL